MRQCSRTSTYAILCLALVPAFLTCWLILEYGVDVVYWEQWDTAVLIEKFSRGTLSAADLFAKHFEYRQFFPHLIMVYLAWLTHWDVRYEMLVSLLLACIVSFNICRLARVTVGGNESRRAWLFFLANLLIFSPAQYENWLFGIQIIYYIPIACITTCMVIACSNLSSNTKVLLCACLATVSTFSSANGILCWVVVLPVLLRWWQGERTSKWLIFGWIVGFAMSAALYRYDFDRINFGGLSEQPIAHFGKALAYFLAFLGAPLAIGGRPLFIAVPVGLALILFFAFCWGYLLKHLGDYALTQRMIVWLMIGTYSVLTGAMVTAARIGYGVVQALDSRYTTFSLYLMLSLIFLIPILLDEQAKENLSSKKVLLTRIGTCAAVLLILLHLVIWPLTLRHNINDSSRQRLYAKACLLVINVMADDCGVFLRKGRVITDPERVYPEVDQLRSRANVLDSLGFLRPPLVKSNKVQDIEVAGTGNSPAYGSFDSLDKEGGDMYIASGWASLPHRGAPPDAVILAYENSQKDFIMFGLAEVEVKRGFIASLLQSSDQSRRRWRKKFPLNKLPTIPAKMKAWALDATTGRAYKLDGERILE